MAKHTVWYSIEGVSEDVNKAESDYDPATHPDEAARDAALDFADAIRPEWPDEDVVVLHESEDGPEIGRYRIVAKVIEFDVRKVTVNA